MGKKGRDQEGRGGEGEIELIFSHNMVKLAILAGREEDERQKGLDLSGWLLRGGRASHGEGQWIGIELKALTLNWRTGKR